MLGNVLRVGLKKCLVLKSASKSGKYQATVSVQISLNTISTVSVPFFLAEYELFTKTFFVSFFFSNRIQLLPGGKRRAGFNKENERPGTR